MSILEEWEKYLKKVEEKRGIWDIIFLDRFYYGED